MADNITTLAKRLRPFIQQATTELVRRQVTVVFDYDAVAGLYLARIPNKLGFSVTISRVALMAGVAPTGADLIVDIKIDGVSIFTDVAHRPRILATAFSGETILIDNTAWDTDSYMTIEIIQVGSTIPGAYLTVTVVVEAI